MNSFLLVLWDVFWVFWGRNWRHFGIIWPLSFEIVIKMELVWIVWYNIANIIEHVFHNIMQVFVFRNTTTSSNWIRRFKIRCLISWTFNNGKKSFFVKTCGDQLIYHELNSSLSAAWHSHGTNSSRTYAFYYC